MSVTMIVPTFLTAICPDSTDHKKNGEESVFCALKAHYTYGLWKGSSICRQKSNWPAPQRAHLEVHKGFLRKILIQNIRNVDFSINSIELILVINQNLGI